MVFKHYDPVQLISLFKRRGIASSLNYDICPGCVLTGIAPEYCFFPNDDLKSPSVQSDMLCPHCVDTAEEYRTKFPLRADRNLNQKIEELRKIMEMACAS